MGLINQTPTQEKPNAYIREIRTVQFIDIFKKVGLINQTPTKYKEALVNQAPTEEESKSIEQSSIYKTQR